MDWGRRKVFILTAGAVLAEASAVRAQIPTATKSSLPVPTFAGVNGDGVTVNLAWWAVKGATGYELLRTADPQQEPVTISLPNTALGYHDTQAGSGPVYYQLVAIDSAGGRAASAWFAYVPPSVQGVNTDGADVVVVWTSVQNAPGGYEVWRAAAPNQRPTRIAAVSSSTRQYRDKQGAGSSSYYQIVAVGLGGSRASSGWSRANGITINPPPNGITTLAQQQIAERVAAMKKAESIVAAAWGTILASIIAVFIQVIESALGTMTDTDRQELTVASLVRAIEAAATSTAVATAVTVALIEEAILTIIQQLPTVIFVNVILDFQIQNAAAGDPQPNQLTRAQIDQVAAKLPAGDANSARLTNDLKKLLSTLKPKG